MILNDYCISNSSIFRIFFKPKQIWGQKVAEQNIANKPQVPRAINRSRTGKSPDCGAKAQRVSA